GIMEKESPIPSSLSAKEEIADCNETSSLSSCINEFETFADEVKDAIPEVDFRGRVHRSVAPGQI
ncbi:hypothetical protein QZH41_011092, partial [Actinostola sp. cb2023]